MSQPEPDLPDASAARSGRRVTGLAVLVLLLVYALSVGPVLKFYGRNPPAAVRSLYAPMEYLHNHVPVVRQFYEWYLDLWGFE